MQRTSSPSWTWRTVSGLPSRRFDVGTFLKNWAERCEDFSEPSSAVSSDPGQWLQRRTPGEQGFEYGRSGGYIFRKVFADNAIGYENSIT